MDLKQFFDDTQQKINSIERRLNNFTAIGGQANTASNIGAGGIGLYQQKVGVDLQFRNINAASARISVVLDAGNNEVDLDVVQAQILHNSLGGLQGGQADEYYHLTAAEHGYVSGVNAQSVLKTASPYFVQLGLLDIGADHELYLKCNENLSADRILNLIVGDAERTITLSGNPTLGDWFDQNVKQTASPTFVTIKLSGLTDGYIPYHVSDASGLANSGIFWDNTNGRFGLGTATPGYLFHAYQDIAATDLVIAFQNARAGTGAYLSAWANSNYAAFISLGLAQSWIMGQSGTTSFSIKDNTGTTYFPFIIEPDCATYTLYLKAGGNVGIGTNAPTSKLQVVGLPVYANNAAAIVGGLTAGALYRTGGDPDPVCVTH